MLVVGASVYDETNMKNNFFEKRGKDKFTSVFHCFCQKFSLNLHFTAKTMVSVLAVVGGPVLSACLKELIDKMKSPEMSNFIRGQQFSPALLKKLEMEFSAADSFLGRAGEKQITDPSVKRYRDQVKDVVYDAEDVLDKINTQYLESTSNVITNAVRNMGLLFGNGINQKMDNILERLTQIQQPHYVAVAEKQPEASSTGAMVDESGVFGRNTEKEELIQLLLSDNESGNKVGVIPIVGMAGIGKTTLVQLVYNDRRLKDRFDLKVWACISQVNDVLVATKKILEAVSSSPGFDSKNLNLLQDKLKESLTDKKFLLVLDNVWEVDFVKWLDIRMILESGLEGSKIIVTTRSHDVAKTMSSRGSVFPLESLTYEYCCLLFEKHSLEQRNCSQVQELQVIGRQIVARFKGFPLAAKALGGHLRSTADAAVWNKVLRSTLWELPDKIGEGLISALRVSYEHLPSHLKCCFDYCSIFPKDYEFDKQRLVLLWMAEDLLENPRGNRSMEEVGHEYIDSLISMSVFQSSNLDGSCFVMHDLFNDLAKSQSGDICFWLEDDQTYDIPKNTRHLSYIRKQFDASKKFEALERAKSLRTFLPISFSLLPNTSYLTHKMPNNVLPDLRWLRVLSVSRYHNIHELPTSIGKLKHLRYIDVSGTAIKELPASTSTLLNLQTLMLTDCYCLTKLPTNMGRLINLRHLDVRGTIIKEMPKHMSRLKNLQTLTIFIVGEVEGSKITELGELNHLQGALEISNLQNVIDAGDAVEAKLKDKTKLDELLLEWSINHNDDWLKARDVLDKLQPHKELKKLTIKHYVGEQFPDWLVSFSNMVFLCLRNCKNCSFLPALGKLASLRELSIVGFENVKSVGAEFYGNDTSITNTFGSLEILRFEDMLAWEIWSYSKDKCEIPCLKELYIVNCPKLNGSLPNHLPILEKLELANCDKLELPSGNDEVTSLNVRKMQISNMSALNELPPRLLEKLAVVELVVYKCPSLKSFPVSGLSSTLKMLHIGGCGELDLLSVDENQKRSISYTSLESLSIGSGCDSLKSFPLGSFPKLNYLSLSGCSNLNLLSIPNGVQRVSLKSLGTLYILGCPELESFPQGGLSTPNLTSFWVWNCKKLKTLPHGMRNLSSLQKLYIGECPELESFPEGGLPSNLKSLDVSCCDKLIAGRNQWNLQELKGLKCLEIGGECEVEKSFPEEYLLPPSLTSLKISLFPKLKLLDKSGLKKLYSLQKLKISECVQLECLPKDCQLKSLSLLEIQGCPKLDKWCQQNGKGWPKISHIPNIVIDGKLIS